MWSVAVLKTAPQFDPNQRLSHTALDERLEQSGELEEAKLVLRQTTRRCPDSAEAHRRLSALVLKQGEVPSAIEKLQRAVLLKPAFAKAQCHLALQQKGEVEAARPAFAKAAQPDPRYKALQQEGTASRLARLWTVHFTFIPARIRRRSLLSLKRCRSSRANDRTTQQDNNKVTHDGSKHYEGTHT